MQRYQTESFRGSLTFRAVDLHSSTPPSCRVSLKVLIALMLAGPLRPPDFVPFLAMIDTPVW